MFSIAEDDIRTTFLNLKTLHQGVKKSENSCQKNFKFNIRKREANNYENQWNNS